MNEDSHLTFHVAPERAGLGLAYHVLGDGPPVVLLHGFTGSAKAWPGRLIETLARGRRVLAIDLPGHGRTAAPHTPERASMREVVRDIAHVLQVEGHARADVVGYSMGARVALGLAVLAPDRVRRLVLESGSPGLATEEERGDRRRSDEALAQSLVEHGLEAFVDRWLALPLFESQRRNLSGDELESEKERRLTNDPRSLATSLRGLGTGTQPSFWGRLGGLAAECLILTGGLDAKFDAIARLMEREMPRATRVNVPDVGHAVHLEAPDQWVRHVGAFLAGP